jgi:hypothetical protein
VSSDHEVHRAEIRAAILRYLQEHPNAADTSAGIAECWFPQQDVEDSAALIAAVLEEMVGSNELQAHVLPGGEILYRQSAGGSDSGEEQRAKPQRKRDGATKRQQKNDEALPFPVAHGLRGAEDARFAYATPPR